jgi:hypothetical protein
MQAALAAQPLAVATPVNVAVEGQAVAVRAERCALGVVAAAQTGQRVGIGGVTPQHDGAQGFEVVVDELGDIVETLACVCRR